MTFSDKSLTAEEKLDTKRSFAHWQSKANETVDERTLRKRKAELYSLVRKVIRNELDPRQQEIVRMHWYEGKNLTEVAAILGLDKSVVYRAEKKINEIIYDKLKYALEYRFGKEFSDKAPLMIKDNPAACSPIDGKDISNRLRNLRLRQSLDTQTLAKEGGIKASRLEQLETQGEQITAAELSKLTRLFGTTSDYIIFGTRDYTKGRSDAV